MKDKVEFKLKWQYKLIMFTIILTTLPALIIGLRLIDKTEQELTQSVNMQLANISNNISNEINLFFVNQIEKQYLIKKSIENDDLGANEKIAMVVSAVSSIDELVSISLLFEEKTGFSTAFSSNKEYIDSLDSEKSSELLKLISNKENVANILVKGKNFFGNPIYIKSLKKWFVYSILDVHLKDAPKAYLVSVIDLSSLQERLKNPSYNGIGSIVISNVEGELIFDSNNPLPTGDILSDAVAMLKGNGRVSQVSNYLTESKKYVVSISFTKNVKWVVIAIENYDRAYSFVSEMKSTMNIWIMVGISLALITGLFITSIIRKPINHLVDKAKEISEGNYDIKVDYKLDDSIGTLGTTMESMSKSIKSSFAKIENQNVELEEYSKTLENKVVERTKKLNETNEDLQKSYLKVLELNNEKNEFLGIAAHDLKNPLVAIKGFGEVIKNDDTLTKEVRADFANTIVESSERMFEIITRLLDINKIEEGRVDIKYAEVSINEIVETLISQNHETASKKNITISFTALENDVQLVTDGNLISQVLDNLISNAIKFSPLGEKIDVCIYNESEVVSIAVKDNGTGLSEDDKQKLFKKFAKLSATPTAGENSTGLGLSIAKKITEMLGGEIFVESKKGEGAEFKVSLPK